MVRINEIVKRYGDFVAIDKVSFEINDSSIYGLVGINGAGKSTLLRTLVGILKPESGSITYDGKKLFDNPSVKRRIAFVPDDLFLPDKSSLDDMVGMYKTLYGSTFSTKKCYELSEMFGLDPTEPFNTFSKGMRRQAATILALSRETKYIFFDETFDGLDPFKRAFVKKIIIDDVHKRGATAIISSHSLRELSDICDKLALLNKGGLILESDLANYGGDITKLQVVFNSPKGRDFFSDLDIIDCSSVGSVTVLIAKGKKDDLIRKIRAKSPLLIEILPLSIEEVFTIELSKHGVNAFDVFGKEVSEDA